ncbi:hypothetical protein ABWI01_03560 [Oceanicaulis alexandrii]|uniref:hypothetical protein n=1 Tax=Oceanicaulis alexandrii TaxID=153233 RepID=UPI0035CF1050
MSSVKNGDTIAVWFSCGAASAIAAQVTIRRYGDRCTIRVINSPIAEEDEDNRRFMADVAAWLGVNVEIATNPKYPSASAVDVWNKRKAMSFPNGGAPCTVHLKKEARQEWEKRNHADWHVLGFTSEEKARFERFTLTERSNVLPVLIDANLSKAECAQRLVEAGIQLPRIYRQGYPNANCIGCVKATSPTYWNLVRREHPEVFRQRAEQSRRLGVTLVRHNGERIYLDELPEAARGAPLKDMQSECGLFCEEQP